MSSTTCEEARRALQARDFLAWTGLPPECLAAEVLGFEPAPFDDLARLPLGERRGQVRFQILPWTGFSRPRACFDRPGHLVSVDGQLPELAHQAAALTTAFGRPGAELDWQAGLLPVPGGEWVFPTRGITLFWNATRERLLHVQVYQPTDLDTYRQKLRLDLQLRKQPLAR